MNKTGLKWPKITIILLTYNGGDGIRRCLDSLKRQTYPKKKVEIIVVDDASTDDSVKISRRYGAKIYISGKHDAYFSWALALRKSTGAYAYMIEQDIELIGTNFLQLMIKPMLEDKRIGASFTTEGVPNKDMAWITRFVSYHPIQCDPLFEFLTPSLKSTYLEQRDRYILCKFELGNIPQMGRMCYRLSYLYKAIGKNPKRVYDHDMVVKMVKKGHTLFAYFPKPGIYHYHATNLKQFLGKRMRNLDRHYFPNNETTEYRLVDTNNPKQVLRLILWIIYANLIIPALIRGVVRFFQHRDPVLLLEFFITFITTDVILWKFLSDKTGRRIIGRGISTIFIGRKTASKGAFGY